MTGDTYNSDFLSSLFAPLNLACNLFLVSTLIIQFNTVAAKVISRLKHPCRTFLYGIPKEIISSTVAKGNIENTGAIIIAAMFDTST